MGRWVGDLLSAENKRQLWIPPGFAHGFLTLTASAEFVYKATETYAPELERCIRWDDPQLAIDWPLDDAPLVAEKDRAGVWFAEAASATEAPCRRAIDHDVGLELVSVAASIAASHEP